MIYNYFFIVLKDEETNEVLGLGTVLFMNDDKMVLSQATRIEKRLKGSGRTQTLMMELAKKVYERVPNVNQNQKFNQTSPSPIEHAKTNCNINKSST